MKKFLWLLLSISLLNNQLICMDDPQILENFQTFESIESASMMMCKAYEHWLSQVGAKLILNNNSIRFWFCGHKDPFANVITASRFDNEKELINAINFAKNCAQKPNVPVTWWVNPLTYPQNTAKILEVHGFFNCYSFIVMVCPLDRSFERATSAVSIRDLASAEVDPWMDVIAREFGYDFSLKDVCKFAAQQNILDKDQEHFIGYYENKVAVTGSLTIEDNFGAIYNIATIPEARNKGLATAMMKHILHRARQLNLQCVILESTPEAQNIYTRLGFKKIYDVAMYVYPVS